MKICICTTPIRPEPTNFPPLGSMAIIQALRKRGEEVHFYNIDYHRPKEEDVRTYFAENQFDIVGISAVVSTAYAYNKFLSQLIRTVSPKTTIIVGGNLAASAEILLRKSEVDFCVVGDGELVIRELVEALYEPARDYDRLKEIRGICFLDETGKFYMTGFGAVLAADEIEMPDWDILEQDGSLPYFISDQIPWDHERMPEVPEGKRFAVIQTDKGCVVRCTFCHRWERGYRVRPVDQLKAQLEYLKERYNVGVIGFATENFGSNRKLAQEFVKVLGDMGFIWRAGAVRVRSVNPEILKFWKENGCTAVYYGIESGSPTMLDVMEKKATREMNIDALKWTYEAGLFTIIQLVVGMPGETDRTIGETIDFLKIVTPYLYLENALPSARMSINYAQALPGTPLYEYARQHGYIGKDMDAEEAYLIKISDTDAYERDHFINYTKQPLLKVLSWYHWMTGEVDGHYLEHTLGMRMSLPKVVWYYAKRFINRLSRKGWLPKWVVQSLPSGGLSEDLIAGQSGQEDGENFTNSGYFNIRPSLFSPLFLNPLTRRFFYPILATGVAFISADSFRHTWSLLFEHLTWSLKRLFKPHLDLPEESLRKAVTIEPNAASEEDMMIPLRMGR